MCGQIARTHGRPDSPPIMSHRQQLSNRRTDRMRFGPYRAGCRWAGRSATSSPTKLHLSRSPLSRLKPTAPPKGGAKGQGACHGLALRRIRCDAPGRCETPPLIPAVSSYLIAGRTGYEPVPTGQGAGGQDGPNEIRSLQGRVLTVRRTAYDAVPTSTLIQATSNIQHPKPHGVLMVAVTAENKRSAPILEVAVNFIIRVGCCAHSP